MEKKKLKQFQKLFTPKSLAIVGAAREPGKLGNIVVKNIVDGSFKGKIFPVNPNADAINGLPCYHSYRDLPEVPDLAILTLPADATLAVLPEIGDAGTKQILILGAGFKEIGGEGLEREKKLVEIIEKYKFVLVGPNCLGFVNNSHNLNATFGQAAHTMGNTRFISQSGAIATGMFDWAHLTGVGFSDFITIGNKTAMDETDILEYWADRKTPEPVKKYFKKTKDVSSQEPIGLYLESILHGERFVAVVSKLSQRNPVFILKPGKSIDAQKASSSHTGAMANDDAVLNAALEKCGAIRCDELENFFDLARSFAWENAPKGPRIAIVSNAGGPAVITTDAIKIHGLELAQFSKKTQAILEKSLPRAANIHNPVDVLGDALADRYSAAIEAVLKEKSVDALIVVLTPQIMTQIEETAVIIGKMSEKYGKPILCSFMGGTMIAKGERVLNAYHVPSFHYPERAVKVFAAMWQWQKNIKRLKKKISKQENLSRNAQAAFAKMLPKTNGIRQVLSANDAQYLAFAAGLSTPKSLVAPDWEGLEKQLHSIQWPVVLKISSKKLLHKTESHAVITNINTLEDLKRATDTHLVTIAQLNDPDAELELQEQIDGGVEVIVGLKRDPSFGPVILFGAGGVMAELLEDRNLLLAPLSDEQIIETIRMSKLGKVIGGFRGGKKYSESALLHIIKTLIAIGEEFPNIVEMEINPVILTENKAFAVDTKIICN